MIWGATGHRPDKLGGYTDAAWNRLWHFAWEELLLLNPYPPTAMIVGMAQGWDQAVAYACFRRKIPFQAYIPFEGQERIWPKPAQKRYHELLGLAVNVVITSEGGYSAYKMLLRDQRIVDDSAALFALYNGSRGGTHHTVLKAEEKGIPIHHAWNRWVDYQRTFSLS